MDKIIKQVLQKIEDKGFEAYLVGGFVRDYLLGIKSLDIDICTNALPKDLMQIFPNFTSRNNYGGFNIQLKKYNIDITTYREEVKYDKRKPIEINYINSLEKDIKRRDFTINSICMDKNEKIIDLLEGVNDLTNHKVKMIGNLDERLKEDPLRILRAIRFSCILNFEIDQELYEAIKRNYKLVSTLSEVRIKQELNKILLNKNFKKGLSLLSETKIADLLDLHYEDITYVSDICGMWSQIETGKNYAFTKQEIRNIINIRQIVKEGIINNQTLFKYGLYNSLVSAELLNINSSIVNKLYNKLPIKNIDDLAITNEEIMDVLNIEPSSYLKEINKELIDLILDNKLKNNKKSIINYLKTK